MGPESLLKVSTLLGLREENQLLVFSLLECGRSSCEPLGEFSSTDVSPCGSGEECHLFGCWDCLCSDLEEVVVGSHPCALGALTDGTDWSGDDEFPNKTVYEECRSSLRDGGARCRTAKWAERKSCQLLFSTSRAHPSSSLMCFACSLWSVAQWSDCTCILVEGL